ncbi:MAG: ANTAR domain-containing response regulator [Actinomycetota bacterium]|nr:ANTAR domain-containing protein [Actinomycetota bacterium]
MPVVRVVIAGAETATLRELAERAGLRVVGEAPTQQSAQALARDRSGEVIIHQGLPATPADAQIPTIVLAENNDLVQAPARGALAVAPSDCSEALLLAAVETASTSSKAILTALDTAEALRDQLETRKLVERAKGILMQRLNLSEGEAYRKLQKASQDENRKMRDVADSIVRTEKILAENISRKDTETQRTAG